jgi:uncharacterized phage-associated protein
MLSAVQVANTFLLLGWKDRSVPVIDQMKLEKLLFYSQAWYLAMYDSPLFAEDFEAWPLGPVVRNVYVQTEFFGRDEVTALLTLQPFTDHHYQFLAPAIADDDALHVEFVHSMWESHKNYSGVQLSNAAHLPGEPWTLIKEAYGSLDSKPIIPNDLIASVYKKKLERSR